ncbi:MAG: anti-sigma factor [Balneolaceae bacterium]|nr:anti-sigma factor [Balneolaceae bacterium]
MDNQEKHNDFEALCAGYVLGALSEEETSAFEEQLRNASAEQKQLLEELKTVRDEIALTAGYETPSPSVEDKLFSSISGGKPTHQPDTKSTNIIPIWIFKAAAALLLVGTLALAYINIDLSETIEQKEVQITELQSELERQDQLLNVLAAREVTLIMMGGLDPSPDGFGKILWDPENRQAVLQLANLPTPPADKDYQLWLIKDGQDPISAGVFNFEQPSTDLFFKVEHLEEAPSPVSNAFAVTLEPAGGMPQPTGDMFLLGAQE